MEGKRTAGDDDRFGTETYSMSWEAHYLSRSDWDLAIHNFPQIDEFSE